MTKKATPYKVDRDKRTARRRKCRPVEHTHRVKQKDGTELVLKREFEMCAEDAEARQVVGQLARSFISTVEFYKTEEGGAKPHDEAVKEALSMAEHRRKWVEGLEVEKVDWGHISAIAKHSMSDAMSLWARVREAADEELESGRRGAKVAGEHKNAYSLAQFLAIRDAFNDQWQPQGGIESAMIDMMTFSFSLQMYWTTIAHTRTQNRHDEQRKQVSRYESGGWKSPYQSEADAVEQAHRLADSYNRQFLRVLRQLRDLRRYAPPMIVNNGGQVNVATNGGQQVNLQS